MLCRRHICLSVISKEQRESDKMVYLVLLEQLTRKKLLIFLGCLVIIQIIYFLIGGLVGAFHDFYLYELILLF
jgi:hypothetical protein